MKLQHAKLVLAGLLMMGCIGVMRSQPILSQPSRSAQSTAIRDTYPIVAALDAIAAKATQ